MSVVRAIAVASLSSLPLLMIAQAALAAPPMRIDDVRFVEPKDSRQIEIVGSQFDNGSFPIVTLDGEDLTVTGAPTATSIPAELPLNIQDGDYLLAVSTGSGNKQNADFVLTIEGFGPGGSGGPTLISVVCIDWFLSGGHDEHIHLEAHVEDEFGNPVNGAVVTFEASYDGFVYQTNVSASRDIDGKNKGAGCDGPTGSGVTDWFCCIGAGKWDGEIPGRRSCPSGHYTAEVLSVDPPPGSNMVWDGVTPPNGRDFEGGL